MKKNFKGLSICLLLFGLLLSSGLVFSQVLQQKTLDRPYEVRTTNFAGYPDLLNIPTSQIHLFAFRSATGKWEPVPFQIDEMDGDVQPNYFATHNGLTDGMDELSYLVKDAGDKVTLGNWIDDEESKTYFRYEIEIYDTTVANRAKVAWVYIYRSSTLKQNNFANYMEYDASADQVKSLFYNVGFNSKGIMDYFSVSLLGGGTGTDILDRQKYYFQGVLVGFDFNRTEEIFITTKVLSAKGPVRIIRRNLIDLKFFDDQPPPLKDMPMTSKFYPHFLQYSSGGIPFKEQYGVDLIRQTWDLSENAIGMKFHNMLNRDVLIDGVPDKAIQDTLEHNVLNWMMATGSQGTILAVNDVSFIGASQRLYYRDNSTVDPNSDDTGDKKSYGEMGIQITGYRIADTLTYKSNIFFLPGNQDASLGDKILNDFATPVTEALSKQNFLTNVKSEEQNTRPKAFILGQNFPNPFNPETIIDFQVPKAAFVKIRILNILGQNIKTLVSQNFEAGRYQFTWNGKNDLGQKVGSGIYFYLMESENFRDMKKMILAD